MCACIAERAEREGKRERETVGMWWSTSKGEAALTVIIGRSDGVLSNTFLNPHRYTLVTGAIGGCFSVSAQSLKTTGWPARSASISPGARKV